MDKLAQNKLINLIFVFKLQVMAKEYQNVSDSQDSKEDLKVTVLGEKTRSNFNIEQNVSECFKKFQAVSKSLGEYIINDNVIHLICIWHLHNQPSFLPPTLPNLNPISV